MSEKSFNSHSFQASMYRSQGLDSDAERNEHFMRQDLANLYDSPSSKEYQSESYQYMMAKNQGREEDAARHKRFMDAAMIKMMEGK